MEHMTPEYIGTVVTAIFVVSRACYAGLAFASQFLRGQ